MCLSTFTSKDKLFFKGTPYFTKNKIKIKIPTFVGCSCIRVQRECLLLQTKEKKDFVHILFESLSSLELLRQVSTRKYVPVMDVLTDLYLEKCLPNAIILSQVRQVVFHHFKVSANIP